MVLSKFIDGLSPFSEFSKPRVRYLKLLLCWRKKKLLKCQHSFESLHDIHVILYLNGNFWPVICLLELFLMVIINILAEWVIYIISKWSSQLYFAMCDYHLTSINREVTRDNSDGKREVIVGTDKQTGWTEINCLNWGCSEKLVHVLVKKYKISKGLV